MYQTLLFPPNIRESHRSEENVTYLEVGDRTQGDSVEFPNDDLKATQLPNGEWALTHKDGRAY